jgi:hypothetical protein
MWQGGQDRSPYHIYFLVGRPPCPLLGYICHSSFLNFVLFGRFGLSWGREEPFRLGSFGVAKGRLSKTTLMPLSALELHLTFQQKWC